MNADTEVTENHELCEVVKGRTYRGRNGRLRLVTSINFTDGITWRQPQRNIVRAPIPPDRAYEVHWAKADRSAGHKRGTMFCTTWADWVLVDVGGEDQ